MHSSLTLAQAHSAHNVRTRTRTRTSIYCGILIKIIIGQHAIKNLYSRNHADLY